MDDVKKIDKLARSNAPLSHSHLRLDLARDTRLFVTRNIGGHVHVTVGRSEATIILHPHAAKRLCANISELLAGEDFTHD